MILIDLFYNFDKQLDVVVSKDNSNNALVFIKGNDNFTAKVINLHKAKNFGKLCQLIKPQDAGFETQTELTNIMQQFYTLDSQEKYGVLGIEIKRI